MLISPEVRNAIHVGDRILEINGLPVGTMMEEEVGPYLARIPDTHGVRCDATLFEWNSLVPLFGASPFLECNLQNYVCSYLTTVRDFFFFFAFLHHLYILQQGGDGMWTDCS